MRLVYRVGFRKLKANVFQKGVARVGSVNFCPAAGRLSAAAARNGSDGARFERLPRRWRSRARSREWRAAAGRRAGRRGAFLSSGGWVGSSEVARFSFACRFSRGRMWRSWYIQRRPRSGGRPSGRMREKESIFLLSGRSRRKSRVPA